MKGIILAGGTGSRLSPLTTSVCKQLLPVYDKPLIYYPLSVLMLAGIRQILIICRCEELNLFESLFGDGSQLGMKFEYAVQEKPEGIAQAFLIGRDFIGNDDVALILGDNIFYGQSFTSILKDSVSKISENKCSALVFGYSVKNPCRYGVLSLDDNGKVCGITEKPAVPASQYAVPGLYFFNSSVVEKTELIKPSKRRELEITDVIRSFLEKRELECLLLGRGLVWMDAGTFDSLLEAGNFVAAVEKRQEMMVACIEEIALNNGWISSCQIGELSGKYSNEYGSYLRLLAGVTE